MSIYTSAKNQWIRLNPVAKIRRKKMRKNLKNRNITFLCPNCIGGILFHDLGLKFESPTVNLMMYQRDFLRFVLNLDAFVNGTLEFYENTNFSFPCAYLKSEGLESIPIHFTHYKTQQEAAEKWELRKNRINKDNMYVFIEERDGLTRTDLEMLKNLKAKGIVAFTCNQYTDLPFTVYIDKYHEDGEVGNILRRNHLTGGREYEEIFDFVSWFNEADGNDYNVSQFIR